MISAHKVTPRGNDNTNNRSDWDDYELPEEYDYSGKEAIRGRFYSPNKKSVPIRLDDDIVLYFRKLAGIKKVGYQSLINAALRERINQTR